MLRQGTVIGDAGPGTPTADTASRKSLPDTILVDHNSGEKISGTTKELVRPHIVRARFGEGAEHGRVPTFDNNLPLIAKQYREFRCLYPASGVWR